MSDFEMMQVTAEYETAGGRDPGPAAGHRPAGGRLVGAGRPQSRADQRGRALQDLMRRRCRPDCRPTDRQASRYPSVRAATGRGQRADRRRARALLSNAFADRFRRKRRASELDDLFTGPARTGRSSGNCSGRSSPAAPSTRPTAQAEARQRTGAGVYQQTIQAAFRDVDDALVAIQASARWSPRLQRQVAALNAPWGLRASATTTATPIISKCSTPNAACSRRNCAECRMRRRLSSFAGGPVSRIGRRLDRAVRAAAAVSRVALGQDGRIGAGRTRFPLRVPSDGKADAHRLSKDSKTRAEPPPPRTAHVRFASRCHRGRQTKGVATSSRSRLVSCRNVRLQPLRRPDHAVHVAGDDRYVSSCRSHRRLAGRSWQSTQRQSAK